METNTITPTIVDEIKEESIRFQGLAYEAGKVIVGQKNILDFIIIAILCNGHILLEGVPGIAKTTMIKAINKALGLSFKRIQFTPDLLPADVIGTLIYNQKTQEFETKKGPIFSHLILADEINRAPAKVQAALLEAMQEQQVTIGSTTYPLEKPFLVFATQNPIEQEGTYQLPEAQVDRFMFKLLVHYPTIEEEKQIISKPFDWSSIQRVLTHDDIFSAQRRVDEIYIDTKIVDYIAELVFATRSPKNYGLDSIASYIQYGVSPRATLALHHASRAHAFLKRRHFVTPDDVKAIAPAVLRHRLILTYEAEADAITSDHIIQKLLTLIPSP